MQPLGLESNAQNRAAAQPYGRWFADGQHLTQTDKEDQP